MGKKTKIGLIIAASLIAIGCIIFGGAMTVLKWDFNKLSTAKFETSSYEIKEPYQNIEIITDTGDIVLVRSDHAASSVVCYEQKNAKHSVTAKDGTLTIKIMDTRKWYEHIGLAFDSPKITVSIPQEVSGHLSITSSTGDVEIPKGLQFESITISESTGCVTNHASTSGITKIKTSTGKIRVEDISVGALDLSVSTGSVTATGVTCEGDVKISVSTGKAAITDVQCANLISSGNTGDLTMKDVIAAETFSIERTTGDVKLDRCDAAELWIQTNTGDVTGSLLTEKVFITQSDTGDINVPETLTGGKCEIHTDTGDIEIMYTEQRTSP